MRPDLVLDPPVSAPDDPLSDLIALADATCVFSETFVADDEWSLLFSDVPAGCKLGVVLDGRCWLTLANGPAQLLERGDCYLLTGKRAYVLATDPTLEPIAFDGRLTRGTVGDVRIAGARFRFGSAASLLVGALPDMLVSPAGSDLATLLPWAFARIHDELDRDRLGSRSITEHLACIVFVQMLRAYVATTPSPAGWLGALAHDRIGRAIRSMHAEPARDWTVDELASIAGMSRSAFAVRFTSLAGTAPLAYLLRWRMLLAERSLCRSDATMPAIAATIGYRSESAFSAAFKRVTGVAPSHFRKGRHPSRVE